MPSSTLLDLVSVPTNGALALAVGNLVVHINRIFAQATNTDSNGKRIVLSMIEAIKKHECGAHFASIDTSSLETCIVEPRDTKGFGKNSLCTGETSLVSALDTLGIHVQETPPTKSSLQEEASLTEGEAPFRKTHTNLASCMRKCIRRTRKVAHVFTSGEGTNSSEVHLPVLENLLKTLMFLLKCDLQVPQNASILQDILRVLSSMVEIIEKPPLKDQESYINDQLDICMSKLVSSCDILQLPPSASSMGVFSAPTQGMPSSSSTLYTLSSAESTPTSKSEFSDLFVYQEVSTRETITRTNLVLFFKVAADNFRRIQPTSSNMAFHLERISYLISLGNSQLQECITLLRTLTEPNHLLMKFPLPTYALRCSLDASLCTPPQFANASEAIDQWHALLVTATLSLSNLRDTLEHLKVTLPAVSTIHDLEVNQPANCTIKNLEAAQPPESTNSCDANVSAWKMWNSLLDCASLQWSRRIREAYFSIAHLMTTSSCQLTSLQCDYNNHLESNGRLNWGIFNEAFHLASPYHQVSTQSPTQDTLRASKMFFIQQWDIDMPLQPMPLLGGAHDSTLAYYGVFLFALFTKLLHDPSFSTNMFASCMIWFNDPYALATASNIFASLFIYHSSVHFRIAEPCSTSNYGRAFDYEHLRNNYYPLDVSSCIISLQALSFQISAIRMVTGLSPLHKSSISNCFRQVESMWQPKST